MSSLTSWLSAELLRSSVSRRSLSCCCCCCCLTCAATAAAMEEAGISTVVKVPFSLGICTCSVEGEDPSEMAAAAAVGCDCCQGDVMMIHKNVLQVTGWGDNV